LFARVVFGENLSIRSSQDVRGKSTRSMSQLALKLPPASDLGWREFLVLYIICYTSLLALYFGLGWVIEHINRKHPERRIQQRFMKDQVAMEIRKSVISLATIAFYVTGGLFAQFKGWTLKPIELGWISGPLSFIAAMVIYDTWFYWGHRMMHTNLLYRFHSLHHKSVVPTPWSNNSDSLIGAFVEQSFFLFAPFFLPLPTAVLILHKIYDHVTGMIGHAGHEYFASPTARRPWPMLCTSFHDQHHGYFVYNYANTFSWWDRLMGTLHPKYDETVKRFESPKKAADSPNSERPCRFDAPFQCADSVSATAPPPGSSVIRPIHPKTNFTLNGIHSRDVLVPVFRQSAITRALTVLCVFTLLIVQAFGGITGYLCRCGGQQSFTQSDHCHGPHSDSCHDEHNNVDHSDHHEDEGSGDREDHEPVRKNLLLSQSQSVVAPEISPILLFILPEAPFLDLLKEDTSLNSSLRAVRLTPPPGIVVGRTVVLLI